MPRFEIFTLLTIQVKIFRVMMLCSIAVGYQHSISILPQHYTVSQPKDLKI